MASAQLIVRDLSRAFDAMPPRMQTAARWMLDHPVDVALLSMRDQARRAGGPPATLSALSASEEQLAAFSTYDEPRFRRRRT